MADLNTHGNSHKDETKETTNADLAHDQGIAQSFDLEKTISLFQEEAKKAAIDSGTWLDHCKELVFEYRGLLQQSKSNYYKKDGEIGYLLNMNWLEKWKKMAYYDYYYRNLMPEYDESRLKEIEPIANDQLILEQDSFYTDIDPNSYYNFILKPNMKMNVDYKPVDEETWNFFYHKYGGVEIKRFYYKSYSFGADIEAKLKEYKVIVLPTYENWDKSLVSPQKSIFTSKNEKFSVLLERLQNILNAKYGMKLTQDLMRPWKLAYNANIDKIDKEIRASIESNMDVEDGTEEDTKGDSQEESKEKGGKKTEKNSGVKFPGVSLEMMKKFDVEDIELSVNDTLVIETASPDTRKFIFYYEKIEILRYGKCEYCYSHKPLVIECKCKDVQYCGDEWMKKDERFHIDKCTATLDIESDAHFEKKNKARDGITGLQNLGNTCFMNSSIQCLSNNNALTKYFLLEKFKEEINKDNVLGTGGKLAIHYARLLNELWNEEKPVVTPWNFKKVVGEFQPMFSGFAQHDSAELLTFALDFLHEDLNRVIKKPYFEMPNLKKNVDEKIWAELAWKYHLLRNQSIIVDLMHGQYKSTLSCPKCCNISETYDPYMMLSLPIPMNEIESKLYYFIFYDSNKCPFKSYYYMKKSSSVIDLRKQIAEQMNVDPWSFVLCQIDDNLLERMYWRNRTVADIADEDGTLFAFQIDPSIFESQNDPDAYKQLDKLMKSSESALVMSNDDDFNNSISRDWVKVPLKLTMMEKSKYSYYERKKAIAFPRILWLNRNWDLITVHKHVFSYLRYFFDINLNDFAKLSEEEAFQSIFEELSEENWSDKLGEGDHPGEFTYTLAICNPEKKSFYSKGMEFFGINNFNNIPLPYTQSKNIGELIDTFYLELENKDESSDDDMKTDGKEANKKEKVIKVKNNKNDGFYNEFESKYKKSKVFELEVFWNKNKIQAKLDKLSRCKKHERFTEIELKSKKEKSEDITLDQCFESFMTTEMLGIDNAWYCRTCKEHVEAKKKMELYSTPNILFISLKRFKSGKGSYFKDKLEDKVFFPVDNLDISDLVLSNKNEDGSRKKDLIYELFAVSNHYGNMGFGHYTAYCKNSIDKTWYDFDDSHVTEVHDTDKVVTDAGYNLFYRKKDFNWDGELDFDSLKQTCNFDDFKLEVAHYAEEETKEETQTNLQEISLSTIGAPSGPVDASMESIDLQTDEAIAKSLQDDDYPYQNSSNVAANHYNMSSDSDKDD